MEKEKQIEEMALAICESRRVADVDNCRKCKLHEDCLYQDIAFGLYKAGYRKQSEWISVEERMPEIGDHYLVVVKQKYEWEAEWDYNTDVAAFVFFDGYIDDVWDTFVDWKEGQETHVTHWMPLPEVPEEFAAHTIPRSKGVAKGKWETVPDHILNTPSTYRHRCIKCDYFYKDKRPYGHKYCPNCGTKMEGGE